MRELAEEWVRKAEEDHKAVKILVSSDEFPPGIVGFHSQQCVEKYLKAFLTNQGKEPPRTHDLMKLNSICAGIDPDFREIEESLHILNPFSTGFRYPGMEAARGEALEAVEHAGKVRDFLSRKLGIGA